MEGVGAINFLALDDIFTSQEGEFINPESIISLPDVDGLPSFPEFKKSHNDPFLQKIHASEEKWVIITTEENEPLMCLDADGFLRHAMYEKDRPNPYRYCHRPIIVKSLQMKLGDVIKKLKVHKEHAEDDVIDNDLILYWLEEKRIITGADILGRLMRGVVPRIDHIRKQYKK